MLRAYNIENCCNLRNGKQSNSLWLLFFVYEQTVAGSKSVKPPLDLQHHASYSEHSPIRRCQTWRDNVVPRPWMASKSGHARERFVLTLVCPDHLVFHTCGVSRLPTSRHRHIGSCRPEQRRRVDRSSQCDARVPCYYITGELQRDITRSVVNLSRLVSQLPVRLYRTRRSVSSITTSTSRTSSVRHAPVSVIRATAENPPRADAVPRAMPSTRRTSERDGAPATLMRLTVYGSCLPFLHIAYRL
ncbi:hypothetical protein BJV78DRAFT_94466 [Lactifluus subvellereus]|nr:hypothetical protein BJV78DRAFT_94466 [Lactifluus subvellereus]